MAVGHTIDLEIKNLKIKREDERKFTRYSIK